MIESQSCTSIIPGEWGPGKTKKQARNFSVSSVSKIEVPVPTDGMKAQSFAVQRDNSFKLSVDECARCWSLFSIHPLAVQGRNESHWKEGSSWRMKEKPTLACSDKSCSLTQHCCRALVLALLPSRKGLIPKACFLLQSSQILICMKMDFRRRREKTAPWPPHLFSSQSHLKNILIIAWQFSQAGQLM